MESYFAPMSEEYKNKHYPDDSVFSAVHKAAKKGGVFLYIFCGLFFLAFGFGAIVCAIVLVETVQAGESDLIGGGIFAVCFCLALSAGCLLTIILTKRRAAGGAEGLIKKGAKNSACDESEIRAFERQALASDSYILALTAKYKAALNGQRDGILTRDYIYLADNLNIILKYSDIVGAFLVHRVIHITVNNKSKRIDSLTISLVSNQNVQTFVDASAEAGTALLAILLEKNPQIQTNGGNVIEEKEFDTYCKEMFASARN